MTYGNGFLPALYSATELSLVGTPIQYLDRPPSIGGDDQRRVLDFSQRLNRHHLTEQNHADPLAARIAANSKDFEARFALAAIHAYEGDFNAAFDQLLEVVMRDKAEWREKARVQLVEWFDACPDAATVSRGRRYLGMYLN